MLVNVMSFCPKQKCILWHALLSTWNFSMVQRFNGSIKELLFVQPKYDTSIECSRMISTHTKILALQIKIRIMRMLCDNSENSVESLSCVVLIEFPKHPNHNMLFFVHLRKKTWFRRESLLFSSVHLWSRTKRQQNHTSQTRLYHFKNNTTESISLCIGSLSNGLCMISNGVKICCYNTTGAFRLELLLNYLFLSERCDKACVHYKKFEGSSSD